METVGFILLTNVPNFDEEELFLACKWLYSLSDEQKKTLSKHHFVQENNIYYRGFAPLIDNDPSHKEIYDVGLDFETVSKEEQ